MSPERLRLVICTVLFAIVMGAWGVIWHWSVYTYKISWFGFSVVLALILLFGAWLDRRDGHVLNVAYWFEAVPMLVVLVGFLVFIALVGNDHPVLSGCVLALLLIALVYNARREVKKEEAQYGDNAG